MLQFKLQKSLYFLTLLIGLISFSGNAHPILIDKVRSEILLSKTSDSQKQFAYEDGLIKSQINSLQQFYGNSIVSLINLKHELQNSNFIIYKSKYIPSTNAKLLLKLRFYTSFMDFRPMV